MIFQPTRTAFTVAAAVLALLRPASAADVPAPVGFATVAAYGVATTTGGGTAQPVVVHTPLELRDAAEKRDIKDKAARVSTPRVILVEGDIDLGPLANDKAGDVVKQVGVIQVGSNVTIRGAGPGATLHHGTLEVHGAHNVIIQNLRFRDLWEPDPTDKYDRLGWDYVRISNSGQIHSHHVWVDHCDFEKAYDGMVDITHGSDLVTISWCRFAGDARGPQKKVSLIGHSSGPTAAATDRGRLNVTLHHNWFVNIDDRAPRARFGNIHVFNNLIEGAQNATISVSGAITLVERSVYRDARIATTFSHADDNVAKLRGGSIVIVDSLNLEPRPMHAPAETPNVQFEFDHNFKGNVGRAELLFNPPAEWTWKDRHNLPYAYNTDATAAVTDLVRRGAGVHPAGH